MVTLVQPIFESLAVFAWCIAMTVIADQPQEGPTREDIATEKGQQIMTELAAAVCINKADDYVAQFAADQQEEVRKKVEGVLTRPAKYNLIMKTKSELVHASSYEAQLRVKVLLLNCCDSQYKESVETALITIAPRAESSDGRFFSEPSNDPVEQDWEITRWQTESVVPYDRNADRR